MSLIKYGIAAAVGYHVGQPRGRKQLEQMRRHVVELSKRPQVKRWQERGWDITYERARAGARLAATTIGGRKAVGPAGPTIPVSPSEAAGTAPAATGFGGRTAAEDSEAARTGLVPP